MWRAWQITELDAGAINAHKPAKYFEKVQAQKFVESLRKLFKIESMATSTGKLSRLSLC